jgi:PhzF family phenazine biosynthesis protein
MPTYRFSQVDVFGSVALGGNPLAVVYDADGLDRDQMQRFASWTGLSETTFLLTPMSSEADYRLRIFTPSRELPFAGHPTLGSAYAWLQADSRTHPDTLIIQECGVGLVSVRREGDRLAFAAPPLTRFEPVAEDLRERLAAGLGLSGDEILDASWLVNGPQWIGVRLASAEQVLSVTPDPAVLAGLDIGLVGPYPPGSETAYEVRALLPGESPAEDPVTGSLNAGLAAWLTGAGLVPDHYVATQGTVLGRAGRIHIDRESDALWVGGRVTEVIRGEVTL